MRATTAMLGFALFASGCAAQGGEPVCVGWSDDCEPTVTQKWEVTTHFEEGRESDTKQLATGSRAQAIGERECGRLPTPWFPEDVTRVEVTRLESGETTSVDCSEVDS